MKALLILPLAGVLVAAVDQEGAEESQDGLDSLGTNFSLTDIFADYMLNRQSPGERWADFDLQETLDQMFNFTGVATTPLGRVTAFVGDVAYPIILAGIALSCLYVVYQVVASVFGLAYDTKLNILSTVFDWLGLWQASSTKASEAATAWADDRSALATPVMLSQAQMMDLIDRVYTAINNFNY